MNALSLWINNLNTIFWQRIVGSTFLDVKSLCVFRIIAGMYLLIAYYPNFSWIGQSPQLLFNPPILSFANLVGSFPGELFFIVLDFLVLSSIVSIILGIRAKIASLAFFIFSMVGFTFQYSFGKIDHNILIFVLFACMAFSGWGSALAVVPDKPVKPETTAKSLSLLSVIICFGFLSAGFEKALQWIDFNFQTTGFASWYYRGLYSLDRHYLLAPYVKYIPFWCFEILDYTAVIFELSSFLFLLHSRKAWHIWLLIASVFHLMNTLLLNIAFLQNPIVYLAFVDYSSLYDRVRDFFAKKCSLYVIALCLAAIIIIRISNVFKYDLSNTLLLPNYLIEANLYFAIFVWVLVAILLYSSIFQKRSGLLLHRA